MHRSFGGSQDNLLSIPFTYLTCFLTRSEKLGKLPGILGVVCQGLTLAFLIVRLYTLYEKKKWVLYTTIPLGLISIALSSFALAGAEANPFGELQISPTPSGGALLPFYFIQNSDYMTIKVHKLSLLLVS